MCPSCSRWTGVTQSIEYRTIAQVLSLATRARQVLLGLLSRQGASSSPYLLGGYHCTYISVSEYLQLFLLLFLSPSDSQQFPSGLSPRSFFWSSPAQGSGMREVERERASVSPRSSRLYPAR